MNLFVLQELTFHWSYFYLSKLWFMFLRMYKLTAGYVCQGLVIIILLISDQAICGKHTIVRWICAKLSFTFKAMKDPTVNLRHCHLTGLFILSLISLIPLFIYVLRKWSRTNIPNFLIW